MNHNFKNAVLLLHMYHIKYEPLGSITMMLVTAY